MSLLLVAATGGHLAQLHRLSPRLPGMDDDAVWVTFDTPQSRSLLAHQNVIFVPFTASRDLRAALVNIPRAAGIIRRTKPSLVVSTGNAIAVSFLPVARVMGVPAAYIESAARADGPSLTGRILCKTPGVALYSQYREWAQPPWAYVGSVFDDFSPVTSTDRTRPRRVLVTLGTIRFGFRRLVARVREVVPDGCEVVWQLGATEAADLGVEGVVTMQAAGLREEMARADVVIAHAGIGSALAALEAGKCPILVPRESRYGEHVDDHQRQIAERLDDLHLAMHRPVDRLRPEDLSLAARVRIDESSGSSPLPIFARAA